MSDFQAIADRVEIEALRGEFTDAVMMRDYDRVASLFTPDGALRMPNIPVELAGREQIRAWGERVPALVDFLVQKVPRHHCAGGLATPRRAGGCWAAGRDHAGRGTGREPAMKAIRIHEPPGISELAYEEVPDAAPMICDVLVKVAACGITHNELDWPVWTCRAGHQRTSIIPGHEEP